MSTHRVDVVRIREIEKHPNADALGVVTVGGFKCCVRLGDFVPGDLVAYIEPDSLVPATEQFAFLGEHRRIKVRKLRGVYSQGLLVRAPDGATEGENVMERLGITHYEPPEPMSTAGEDEKSPPGFWPVYDVESFNRYPHVLVPGEPVCITEKRHGCSARYVCIDGAMHCGSRTRWKRDLPAVVWWKALRQNPWIEQWCRAYPARALYGEVFGQVQDLKYGAIPGQLFFEVFDVWDGGAWLNYDTGCWQDVLALGEKVPTLYVGPFDESKARALAEGKSTSADCLREGCVIRAVPERAAEFEPGNVSRVQLKIVGNGYLERA